MNSTIFGNISISGKAKIVIYNIQQLVSFNYNCFISTETIYMLGFNGYTQINRSQKAL